MHTYHFLLGHQPHISTAELYAVFSRNGISGKPTGNKNTLMLETEQPLDAAELMEQLGGTIKIIELVADFSVASMVSYLQQHPPEGKIHFSLSGAGKNDALAAKKLLKAAGRSVRYIMPKNSATVLHNGLVKKETDLSVLDGALYVTRALQPFEQFGKRDYGRPENDALSGMLPPKLARIMINLAEADSESPLLDPFCGSGTVLMEALALGYRQLYGSDLSEKAVHDAEKNLAWLTEQTKHTPDITITKHDATTPFEHLEKNSVGAIVTEPYLGKPLHGNENRAMLIRQTEELSSLYASAFAQFAEVLAPGGSLVIAIPQFPHADGEVRIDPTLLTKKTGLTHEPFRTGDDSLRYHRPGQHLVREIWKFRKSN